MHQLALDVARRSGKNNCAVVRWLSKKGLNKSYIRKWLAAATKVAAAKEAEAGPSPFKKAKTKSKYLPYLVMTDIVDCSKAQIEIALELNSTVTKIDAHEFIPFWQGSTWSAHQIQLSAKMSITASPRQTQTTENEKILFKGS